MSHKVRIERIWETASRLFGGFKAEVRELGISAEGKSEDEALAMLMEKIARHWVFSDQRRRAARSRGPWPSAGSCRMSRRFLATKGFR
jgi:hypothetical protein